MSRKREYLIMGAGHQGLAMAAHFSLCGEKVSIWNRTKQNIESIILSKYIECEGIFQGKADIWQASDDLESVLTDTIFITTPSTAHRDIAKRLAGIIKPNTVVYLNPGRTFGAIEFAETLNEYGCQHKPTIVETQSIVYTCRRQKNKAHIFALKDKVEMAYIGKEDAEEIKNRMPMCIRDRFEFVPSVLETSLGNIGMILHCAPVLLNAGWIESPQYDFLYYYDGITPSIGDFLERLDHERCEVAKRLGIGVFTLIEWFEKTYGVHDDSIYKCVQANECYRRIDAPSSLVHRYLDEDIPNGLVPLEYLGKSIGVDVCTVSLIIDLACAVRKIDYRRIGRKYSWDTLKSMFLGRTNI